MKVSRAPKRIAYSTIPMHKLYHKLKKEFSIADTVGVMPVFALTGDVRCYLLYTVHISIKTLDNCLVFTRGEPREQEAEEGGKRTKERGRRKV